MDNMNKLPSAILSSHLNSDWLFACTRAWSAWNYGTMTRDDFEELWESEAFNYCYSDIVKAENEMLRRAEKAEKELSELKERVRWIPL